jgi:hypothetical protein
MASDLVQALKAKETGGSSFRDMLLQHQLTVQLNPRLSDQSARLKICAANREAVLTVDQLCQAMLLSLSL